jgi:hypothetical protein
MHGMQSMFKIDLTKLEGDGEFPCPACGTTISPDDYSGITYNVLKVKMKPDGTIGEVCIQCEKCRSTICLVGFGTLQGQSGSDEPSTIEAGFSFQADLRTT